MREDRRHVDAEAAKDEHDKHAVGGDSDRRPRPPMRAHGERGNPEDERRRVARPVEAAYRVGVGDGNGRDVPVSGAQPVAKR